MEAFDYSNMYYGQHLLLRNGELRHVTELNGADSLDYLRNRRPRDKKFCLTVSFFAPHAWDNKPYPDQYVPQNYTEGMYDDITIPIPEAATLEEWEKLPWFFTDQNVGRTRWGLRYDTPEHYQVSMKRYYRMVSEIDDVVGALIDELKAQGVYDNTMLIFTTDNGQFHGEHQLAGKWYPHDESIRVPLIIQDPRMPDEVRGTVKDEFTLSTDLAPTILSAAGLTVPERMQGQDISELYLNPDGLVAQSWRRDFFYEFNRGDPETAEGHDDILFNPACFALVQKDWKYFYWPQADLEQLFNIADDPFEQNDLLNSTAVTNLAKLEELRSRYKYLKLQSQSNVPV